MSSSTSVHWTAGYIDALYEAHLEDHGLAAPPLGLLLPLGDAAGDDDVLAVLGPDGEGVGVGAVVHRTHLVNLDTESSNKQSKIITSSN